MFDNLKNLASLPGLMSKAREVQEKMKTMQEELAGQQVSALSPGGEVTAIVSGRLEVVRVRINPASVDPQQTEKLELAILAAINSAQAQAAEMMRSQMQKIAEDAGLPPGMLS